MVKNPEEHSNRLANSSSPYLREAAAQPVNWYPWGKEAFEAAQEVDRPILLDIGAAWCHWCHVMDRESYNDPEIAAIINQNFIPIKVDRDERPEIDSRYQKAIQAISGQGGWPLTGFLTPDGDLFFGGTYFPPEQRYGRPGMKEILPQVAAYYREKQYEIKNNIAEIREFLKQSSNSLQSSTLNPAIRESLETAILRSYDPGHGGFGQAPKFPSTPALEFANLQGKLTNNSDLTDLVNHTLTSMANGGIRDQLGGAFHRYSVDDRWQVPHFEVMSYVNSEMLRLYLQQYQITGEEHFKEIANGLIDYILRKGADTKAGGFYASQDADYSMADDGNYWTWTLKEIREVLNEDSAQIMIEYFGLTESGDMRESPGKNVLHTVRSVDELASVHGKNIDSVREIIDQSKAKLLAARGNRPEPSVDTSRYTNWNSMMSRAFLEAGRILDREELTALALKTLDRIWQEGWHQEKGVVHRLGDKPGGQFGLLSDQVFFALALFYAFEYSGKDRFLTHARDCLDYAIHNLWNTDFGGFDDKVTNQNETGPMSIPAQPIQDSPTPGENAIAALALQRYYLFTGDEIYHRRAEQTIERFAGSAAKLGVFGGTFGLAVSQLIREPLHILVIGSTDSDLWRNAYRAKYPWEVLQHVDPKKMESLPEIARKTAENLEHDHPPAAIICTATSCTKPAYNSKEFITRLSELRKIE